MLHQSHARVVREEIAQQALDQTRSARQYLAYKHDRDLKRDQFPEAREVRTSVERGDYRVDYQLPDPERCDGHERAREPERDHRRGVASVCLPDEL